MELKLRHLLELCRLLKVHPRDLIERGLPNWKATRRLDDLGR
jgi:DNA-binding Xre family transcriptional regulator